MKQADQQWTQTLLKVANTLRYGSELMNADYPNTGADRDRQDRDAYRTPTTEEKRTMGIFTHVVVGTNDLERARSFYDATLGVLGLKRVMNLDKASLWGIEAPEFMVTRPGNGQPATHANGGTISFAASSLDAVRKFHEVALANGAKDEGAPGPRSFTPTAYAAYVRDPDGNKICAYCFAAE